MRRLLIVGTVLAGLGAALGYGGLALYTAPGPLGATAAIIIPHGGLDGVGDALKRAGAIGNVSVFKAAAALTAWQGALHAGEFSFPAHASLETILLVLRIGRPIEHKVTIAEGLTAAQIALVLAQADGLTGEIEVPPEGGVLPQTYLYERGATAESVLKRAEAGMRQALDQAWGSRSPELGATSRKDLLVMASLVERETHLPAERPLVAGVFYNRLTQGMRLQSDASVLYAASGGSGELARALSHADLVWPSPYNTYEETGLPAGPICSPGIASIRAAAHPAHTKALYFVADGTGGHFFSDSLNEHMRNVAHYRTLER